MPQLHDLALMATTATLIVMVTICLIALHKLHRRNHEMTTLLNALRYDIALLRNHTTPAQEPPKPHSHTHLTLISGNTTNSAPQ